MRRSIWILIVAWVASAVEVVAQVRSEVRYNAEVTATFGSKDRTPFWLTANRYGLGSVEDMNGYGRAGISGSVYLPKHWQIDAAVDVVAGWNMASDVWLQQCYADFSWKMLRVSFGAKESLPFPLEKNAELTSGWMTEGINMQPVPQIRLDIKEYLPIGFLGNWLALKGHLAYGKFTDGDWKEEFVPVGSEFTTDILYHSKSIMFRIGKKEKFPLEFEFGLQMATQFGGAIYKKLDNGEKELVRKMPTDIGAYWAAFFPSHGGADTERGEQTNVEGNMLGSWIFGLNYYLNDWKFRIHYDHYFEDHSQMFWEYGRWKDGQIGIEVTLPKNKWISNILWEGINTTDQTGSIYYDAFDGTMLDAQTSGADNYYNHGYYNSWQHYGTAMGNPLIISSIYNKNHSLTLRSNRMRANHVGISGQPNDEWKWRLLATHTKHWGTYSAPLDKVRKQFSGMVEVSYTPQSIKGWNFTMAMAYDNGNYLGNCMGGMISIKKVGNIFNTDYKSTIAK